MRERERMVLFNDALNTFIYGYMVSDIWLRTILILRKENRCRHIGYSYWLTARVVLYASSHRQDNTYHGLCYTSRGALAEREIAQWVHPMKDRSDDPSHHKRTLYLWATSRSLNSQWVHECIKDSYIYIHIFCQWMNEWWMNKNYCMLNDNHKRKHWILV